MLSMALMFYNCSSLSSLPDISKWNIKNVIKLFLMFSRCISLISMPDISKWKAQNLKEMNCLFSDCNLLLYFPDVSNWNNYNENDLNEKPDYKRIKDVLKISSDTISCLSSPENADIFNNIEYTNK